MNNPHKKLVEIAETFLEGVPLTEFADLTEEEKSYVLMLAKNPNVRNFFKSVADVDIKDLQQAVDLHRHITTISEPLYELVIDKNKTSKDKVREISEMPPNEGFKYLIVRLLSEGKIQ